MTIRRILGPAGRTFSSSLQVQGKGTWVYVSGKMGTDQAGAVVAGGLGAQAEAALDQIIAAVKEAGGTAENVVKLTAYLTSLDEYEIYNQVRGKVFGATRPVSTAIGIMELILPGAVIEIDGVAFVPDPG